MEAKPKASLWAYEEEREGEEIAKIKVWSDVLRERKGLAAKTGRKENEEIRVFSLYTNFFLFIILLKNHAKF